MMKLLKILVLATLCIAPAWSILHGQSAVTVTGRTITDGNASFTYSAGQWVFIPVSDNNHVLFQGIIVPNASSRSGTPGTALEYQHMVFPNPVSDQLILQIEDPGCEKWEYQLFDSYGKLIIQDETACGSVQIPFTSLSPGLYFLTTIRKGEKVESFKIIKE